ncbi:MAG: MBL fold metallo-hydrolase [Spirochaetota bacterium]
MERVFKMIGIAIACIAAVLILAVGALAFMMKDMRAGASAAITDGVYCIKGARVNCYAVSAKTGFILVDAGDSLDAMKASLTALQIDPSRVASVFLTHSDGDHTAGLPLFPNARVYLSHEENDLVTGKKLRHLFFFSRTNHIPAPVYSLVSDGEVAVVGGTSVRAMSTPGHTPGSYSYLIDGKYLFTGDSVILIGGHMKAMGKPFTEDAALNERTVAALKTLTDVAVLGTAHTGYTTNWDSARR